MSHAYVMFWSNSLSTQIYCFARQNPFSFWISEQFRRSVKPFSAVSGNSIRLLPSTKCHTIKTVWLPKTSTPHVGKFSSLLIAYTSKQQTHHDSRHWPRLCTGSGEIPTSDEPQLLWGVVIISKCISSVVAPTKWSYQIQEMKLLEDLKPHGKSYGRKWKYKRIVSF